MEPSEAYLVQREFTRAASTFADRTAGRFDQMDVVGFVGDHARGSVAEIGVGTGNFLSLFGNDAAQLVGVDLTRPMLEGARSCHPDMILLQAHGARLPLRSRSIDLVTSAQTFHHIRSPIPVLEEMRRVVTEGGRILVVDQVATEKIEEAEMMNALDLLRDPSHAACRPPSALRIIVRAAGLEIEKETIIESTETFSKWTNVAEFPAERVSAVREFVEAHGDKTGMEWREQGGELVYTRRRMMLLARRAG